MLIYFLVNLIYSTVKFGITQGPLVYYIYIVCETFLLLAQLWASLNWHKASTDTTKLYTIEFKLNHKGAQKQ